MLTGNGICADCPGPSFLQFALQKTSLLNLELANGSGGALFFLPVFQIDKGDLKKEGPTGSQCYQEEERQTRLPFSPSRPWAGKPAANMTCHLPEVVSRKSLPLFSSPTA